MKRAILPAKPFLSMREIRVAFGYSPQYRVWLSNEKGFPRPISRQYPAAEVIARARRHGWTVEVV